jgi:hypothetical protein
MLNHEFFFASMGAREGLKSARPYPLPLLILVHLLRQIIPLLYRILVLLTAACILSEDGSGKGVWGRGGAGLEGKAMGGDEQGAVWRRAARRQSDGGIGGTGV